MGIDAALDAFMEHAGARGFGIDGVVVTPPGGGRLERRRIADLRRDVFSVSKTVTSLAIGIAASEGLLEIDAPVLGHLPRFADRAAPGVEAMTVRHLLRMTAGNEFRSDDPDADFVGDPAVAFLAAPLVAAPDMRHRYAGGDTSLLGRIVHAVSGLDLRDYLVPRLFAPLGIHNPQWLRDPLGFPIGAIGLVLRTSEIDAIARLLLHEGMHEGRRLVPRAYVTAMRTDTTATGRPEPDDRTYGLHVWQCARDDAWRMDGIHGQFGIVLPQQGATVSVTAHYGGPTTEILDAVWTDLVPALG